MHFLIEEVSEVEKERDEKRTGRCWCDPRQSSSWASEAPARECWTAKLCRRRSSSPPVQLQTRGPRAWLEGRETGSSHQSRATGRSAMEFLHTQMGTSGTRWCLLKSHQPLSTLNWKQRVKSAEDLILCQKLWYNYDLISYSWEMGSA